MKTLTKTETIDVVEILSFDDKGNAVIGGTKKKPEVVILDNAFVGAYHPQVGDFLVKQPRGWGYLSAVDAAAYEDPTVEKAPE